MGGGWLALFASACQPEYSLPPTLCDDYCLGLLRGHCKEDEPADCVRTCELGRSGGNDCDGALATLGECFANASDDAFYCSGGVTQIRSDACLSERRAFGECTLGVASSCFDECVRQALSCGRPLADCEQGCRQSTALCQRTSDEYNACLLRHPVECRPWLQLETREPEDVPCYTEALTFLACFEEGEGT